MGVETRHSPVDRAGPIYNMINMLMRGRGEYVRYAPISINHFGWNNEPVQVGQRWRDHCWNQGLETCCRRDPSWRPPAESEDQRPTMLTSLPKTTRINKGPTNHSTQCKSTKITLCDDHMTCTCSIGNRFKSRAANCIVWLIQFCRSIKRVHGWLYEWKLLSSY